MESEAWVTLSANLVKIGNSFCVRIPKQVIKSISAEEGSILALKLKKLKLEISPEILDRYYKIARSCSELRKFSDDKIYLLSRLSFNEGRYVLEKMDEKMIEGAEYERKSLKHLNEFRKNIQEQFGDKVYRDFLLFRKYVDKLMEKQT